MILSLESVDKFVLPEGYTWADGLPVLAGASSREGILQGGERERERGREGERERRKALER